MKNDRLIEINCDLFDIAARLREINSFYRVFYNKVKSNYEIHNLSQKGSSYCLTLPFDELDARAVEFVKMTSISRADKLFSETEKGENYAGT